MTRAAKEYNVIEVENRTRQKYRFPRYMDVTRKDGTVRRVIDRNRTIVIGDSADAEIPDEMRTIRTPNPVVRLSAGDLAELDPISRGVFNALVGSGVFRVRELAG